MTEILLAILKIVVEEISPEVRKLVVEFYNKLKEIVSKTNNKFDDLFLKLLGSLLGIE